MIQAKKILIQSCAALTLTALCQFASALSPTPPSGTSPSKRTIEYDWMPVAAWDKMHAEDKVIAEYEDVNVLFLGDSITAGWDWQIWEKNFKPLKAANFGIGGDHTANVLWRLQHGAIGNMQPKVIVLLIGVNNFGHLHETPEQVAAGVTNVVAQLQLAWPSSKILLNGVFPFDEQATSVSRQQVKKVNQIIAQLDNRKTIFYKDYGPLLLQKNGNISPAIMKDFLHPTSKGYQIWADAMLPDIQQLLK
ncbi:GDSL-type esterase/lipase family protein [Cellvibrio sp. OA-2007]|uniref:GDSL-type esterase/lipase family protein n=1 Tax=Cellvibrio sp. OA-2007 TaxID=529823 RepID=UPI000AD1DF58|nr:GDSL-type esterase/lipase family protein [Cellvibrio sp. OA-2007]